MFNRRRERGQALVEFSIAVIPFLIILMGVVDLGRAIYQMNTTAQAAREIARVTTVHEWTTCCQLGSSTEVQGVIATQRSLLPGMQFDPAADIQCVDLTDTVVPDGQCQAWANRLVRVTVRSSFAPVTPLLSIFGSQTLTSIARVESP